MYTYIENIEAEPIVYMRSTGEYGEKNYLLMQTMKEWMRENDLLENNIIYAAALDDSILTSPEKCRYDVCCITERQFDDDAVQSGTLLPGQYLICRIPHTPTEVQAFWNKINTVLEAEHQRLDADRFILERYPFDLVRQGFCEFCIPVQLPSGDKTTEVVAALIWEDNRFMICQRPANKARGLLWEFVGGKVEPGETKEQALIRECTEELAIKLSVNDVFMDVVHEYPDLKVHLTLFNATIAEGIPQRLEHNDIQWITIHEIPEYNFCPADEEILKKLSNLVVN